MQDTQKSLCAFVKENESLVYTVCLQILNDPCAARSASERALCFAWRRRAECPDGQAKVWLVRIAVHFAKSSAGIRC